jgi:hypothetical protein
MLRALINAFVPVVMARSRYLLGIAGVACVCIAGCRNDRPKPGAIASTAPSLGEYCKGEPCRRYEDALAKLEELARPGSGCSVAETGSCGEFRYVEYSSGYVGYVQYFGASGPMVGAQTWSDIEARKNIGGVPTCTPIVERRLCGTSDAGG